MTAKQALEQLIGWDAQFISGRPTPFAPIALLIATLCEHAEGSLRDGTLNDWMSVDLSRIEKELRKK